MRWPGCDGERETGDNRGDASRAEDCGACAVDGSREFWTYHESKAVGHSLRHSALDRKTWHRCDHTDVGMRLVATQDVARIAVGDNLQPDRVGHVPRLARFGRGSIRL